jgi:hypothetical protein
MYRAYQAFSYPVTFCSLQSQDNAAFEARLKMVHVQRAWEASKAILSKDIVPVNGFADRCLAPGSLERALLCCRLRRASGVLVTASKETS